MIVRFMFITVTMNTFAKQRLYPMNLANSKGIRKDWCPLIPLPEKHGRLKDADALCADLTSTVDRIYSDMIEWAIGMVEAQSTAIEAEEI